MKKISLFAAILAIFAILLVLPMAGTAVAEIRPGFWTLSPTVGGYVRGGPEPRDGTAFRPEGRL